MFQKNNQTDYLLNTKKLYKIWFSKDPNIFLNIQNQLRFIKMYQDNPQCKDPSSPNEGISFIYSSKLLNADAQKKMNSFCKIHKITPVDFDTEIFSECKDKQELQLFNLAKEELYNWVDGNGGGNPAAASDILRFSKTIIQKYGIYSDFDVEVSFSQNNKNRNNVFDDWSSDEESLTKEAMKNKKPEEIIPLESPITIDTPMIISKYCNDFIACATTDEGKINDEALKYIDIGAQSIISQYERIKKLNFNDEIYSDRGILSSRELEKQIKKQYLQNNQENDRSVIGFRSFINNLKLNDIISCIASVPSLDNNLREEIKNYSSQKHLSDDIKAYELIEKVIDSPGEAKKFVADVKFISYKKSVTDVTGPGTLGYITWDREIEDSFDQIKKYVKTQGTLGNDLSWMSSGIEKTKSREENLVENANKINKFIKKQINQLKYNNDETKNNLSEPLKKNRQDLYQKKSQLEKSSSNQCKK